MRFMLLQNYGRIEGVEPMSRWAPEESQADIAYQQRINAELTERGELIDGAQARREIQAMKDDWRLPRR